MWDESFIHSNTWTVQPFFLHILKHTTIKVYPFLQKLLPIWCKLALFFIKTHMNTIVFTYRFLFFCVVFTNEARSGISCTVLIVHSIAVIIVEHILDLWLINNTLTYLPYGRPTDKAFLYE